MFIRPAPGLLVRDPVTKALLPEAGAEVSDSDLYWHRRLRDGDVVPVPLIDQPRPHRSADA